MTEINSSTTTNDSSNDIAIVGMGFRFPKSSSPDEFWNKMSNKFDGISKIPNERWSSNFYDQDYINNEYGGILEEEEWKRFDPLFFGLSPKEAPTIDPQQRLLLTTLWEAFEDSQIKPSSIRGSDTGVFIGMMNLDYQRCQFRDISTVSPYTVTGNASSFISNRLSFAFDLRGPSMTIDTACSSSLNAVYLGCQAITTGDCKMAVVGGVNGIFDPTISMTFSGFGMLGHKGQCRSFDADADGFIRGEGAGVCILKKYSDAVADGDRIYCVIKGGHSNVDGYNKKTNITAPSMQAQSENIEIALRKSKVSPEDVYYIEAHGTGTPVGDPIEIEALSKVFKLNHSPESPLFIGSVKSNMGHLESAAGIASIIKVGLMLKHRSLMPNIHFDKPNPLINFEDWNIRVVTDEIKFPSNKLVTMGVNSFGLSGSNCHMILSEAPINLLNNNNTTTNTTNTTTTNRNEYLIPFSANSKISLDKYIDSLLNGNNLEYFKSNISFKEFVMHQSISKSNLVKRKVITASDWDDLKNKRNEVTTSSTLTSTISTPQSSTPLIFVFVGQGPQWKGMLDKLYSTEPIFKETVDKCDLLLSNYFGYSIFSKLKSLESDESPELHHPQLAQPSIFLVQVALVELYKSYNINPSIVVGHSFGEVTSALYSGIIDLETAVKIVYHRSTLQNLTIGTGKLLSIGIGQQSYLEKIKGTSFNEDIEIACFNDPNSIVITGTEERLQQIKELLSKDGIFCAFLGTPCSFHSSKQELIKDKVFDALKDLPETNSPVIPFFSTITGEQMTGKGFYDAQYIYDNLRNPVDFTKAISNIYKYIEQNDDMKNAIFLEIGPHPTLGFYIPKCKSSDSTITTPTLIISPLHKKKEVIQQFKIAISTLFCNGVEVDFGKGQFNSIDIKSSFKESTSILPRYQWDTECYWEEPNSSKLVKRGPSINVLGHDQFSGNRLFELFIDIKKPAYQYLKGHKIKGKYLFPGSGYIDNILRCYQGQDITLFNLEFSNPFFLTEGIQHHLQTTFTSLTKGGGEQKVEFFIKDNRDSMKWTKTSNGRIGTFQHRYKNNNTLKKDIEAIKRKCNFTTLTKNQVYSKLLLLGLPYGPTFQRVESTLLGDGCSFSKISMTPTSILDNEQDQFFNPSIIDCCLHGLLSLSDGPQEIIFDRLEDLKYYSSNVPLKRPEFIYVYAQFTKIVGNSTHGSIDIMLEDGTLLISIKQVKCTSLIRLKKSSTIKYPSKDVYSHHWQLKNSQLISPLENQLITDIKSDDVDNINNLLNNQLFNQYLIGLLNKSILSEFNSFDCNNSTMEQLSIDIKNKELFENVKSILTKQQTLTTTPLDTIKSQLFESLSSFKKEIYLVEKSIKRIVNTLKGGADTEHLSPSNPSSPLESPRKSIVNSHGDNSADSDEVVEESTTTTTTNISNEPFNFSNSKFLKSKNLTIVNLVSNILNPLINIGTGTNQSSKKLVKIIQIFDNQNVNLVELVLTNLNNQLKNNPKLIKNLEIEFTILISNQNVNSKSIELIKQSTKQYQIESNGILNIKYRSNIELLDGDLEEQGLLLSNYDLIISSFLFYSTLDVNELLVKLYKLLLPLGQLIMLEPPQNVLAFNLLFSNSITIRSIDQFKSLIQFNGFTKIAHSNSSNKDQSLIIIQSQKREIESMSMTFSSNLESLNTSYSNIVFIASGDQINLKPKYLEEYFDITEIFGDNTKLINGDTLSNNQDDQLFISSLGDNDIIFFISSLGDGTLTIENYQLITMQYTLINQILLKNSLSTRFVLLTNQSQNSGINYLGASLIGTYRYFLEFQSLNIYSIDVDNESIENLTLFLRVVDPLTIGDREIVIRSNQVFVQRIFKESSLLEPSENYEKDTNNLYMNTNSNLEFQFKCKPLELPNDYVEIKVMATGINYKDNLYFRGLLPPDLFLVGDVYNPPFGLECSGIVTRVGSNVSRFKKGDQVVGFASHSLSSHAITSQDKLVLKPSNVSFTDAAAVCVVYATSYYAIFHIGTFMSDKESILIHSATGGVGLATLNLLKWKRNQQQQSTTDEVVPPIYVTVGSDEKVEYLKSKYGSLITNIFNSRDTEYSSEIKSQSDGVDLILNTLSGDYLSANFRSLSQLGRIMDLSVTQLVDNDSLDFGNFKFHIGYQTIDLERASKYNSKVVRDILTNVFSAIADGSLENIPVKVFPCTQVKNAIEFINERVHIGKIVVDFSNFENDILLPAISETKTIINNPILSNQILKSNFTCSNQLSSTILITGQTGIAVHIIKWIISGYNNPSGNNGIDFIILSRSSLKWELEYLINSTKSRYGNKFRFHYKSVDISNLNETRNSINEIYSSNNNGNGNDNTIGPIKSLFHFATVYEYVQPEDINLSVISNTHGPKAIGAINLHNLSIELNWKLNHFILFSSIGAIIGGSKQCAYASANYLLDSLANYRKSIGLSACSINWGGLDAGGVVATDKSVFEFLQGQGILLVSLPKILGGLDACFQFTNSSISNFMLSRFNTDTLLTNAPQMKRKMEHHLTIYKSKSDNNDGSNGLNGVDSVQEKLVNTISELLSIHPSKLNLDTRLKDFGIDSLVTVQLKNFIDREFGMNLFTHLQLSSNSINSIIQRINSKK